MSTAPGVVLPGIHGSDPGHWQSLLERDDPTLTRIRPSSWDVPELDDWIRALDEAVAAAPEPPVLIAHSLGTLLVAHWAHRPGVGAAAGALLVAIPDDTAASFPAAAPSFRNPPRTPLPFRSVAVVSTDDPYTGPAAARATAQAWGSRVVDVGASGHVNVASGHGPWELGRRLVAELRSRPPL